MSTQGETETGLLGTM